MDPINLLIQSQADTTAIDQFNGSLGSINDVFAALQINQVITQFEELGASILKAGFDAAAGSENIRVGFDSAFGSGASGMLNNLDNFSYRTVLTNVQLDNMALKLQTAGLASNQIASSLKDITNVSSGTGTSIQDISQKADAMTQALSRAQQYGSISSLFLRPLISDNIPIIGALVDVINKSGGAYDQSAATIAKHAKELENAKAKHDALTHQISDEEKQLAILQETQLKVGFGHLNSAKTLDSHSKAVADAQYKLQLLNTELEKTNQLISNPTAGPITSQDLLNNARSITITAQQLQDAYKLLGEGKYAGDAQKQADTLNGTMKNLKETFLDVAKNIIGVNNDDTVQKGGIFATLKNYAMDFFNYLQGHKTEIETWFKTELKVVIDYIVNHKADIDSFFKNMVKDLSDLGKWFTDNKQTIDSILNFIGGTIQFAGAAAATANSIGKASGNILGGISTPGTAGDMGHLNYAALNNVIGTSPVGQAFGYNQQNLSKNTQITLNNTVNHPADWQTIIKQISFAISGH